MARTVNGAFNEFLKNKVNLDHDRTKKAHHSKKWLMDQIHEFPNKDTNFPILYSEKDISLGSFARKTQIRPLDDIDIMVCISAQGSTYNSYSINNVHELTVPQHAVTLRKLCNDKTDILNSIKVINKFKSMLINVPQYGNSEIKRNQEAVTLKLTSYDWNFDIVPCFHTTPENDGRDYYLIPDGNGNWKKTDPRMDRDKVIRINQQNDGKVLNAIRLMKYWNNRPTMPSIKSYLIENMVLNYYEVNKTLNWVDLDFSSLLYYIKNNISNEVQDPKNIQGDLNTLTEEQKTKIKDRADSDYTKSRIAIEFETQSKDDKSSINKWKEIFGSEFPDYN